VGRQADCKKLCRVVHARVGKSVGVHRTDDQGRRGTHADHPGHNNNVAFATVQQENENNKECSNTHATWRYNNVVFATVLKDNDRERESAR
jgi:hypothetical protein